MHNTFSELLSQPLNGKVVIVRVDFNVPIANDTVSDNTRIKASLPTIQALSQQGARVVLITHLKRPDGKIIEALRLNAVRDELQQLLDMPVRKTDECIGEDVRLAIEALNDGDVLMLENIRFYDEETANDADFSDTLASYADFFVQDAFGTVHRCHASTVGIAQRLPAFSGQLLDKEINYLGGIITNPQRPFVAIVGGSKISTKFMVLDNLLNSVDALVLGGAMVYTLLKAQGHLVGQSLVEDSLLDDARAFLERVNELNKTLVIPTDHRVVTAFDQPSSLTVVGSDEFEPNHIGIDIGPQSEQHICSLIHSAQCVFWNGPVGVFETKAYASGTNAIAKALAESSATTIVGGGDSIAAINQSGYANVIDHISTGGGASLEFLEGKVLPGISVLQ